MRYAHREKKRGLRARFASIARRRNRKQERREIMAVYCAETGKPNSGRQWRKLRKALGREERAIARRMNAAEQREVA